MTCVLHGVMSKTLDEDEGSHRTYTLTFYIESDNQLQGTADGPQQVLNTPGLPIPGNIYAIDADLDAWAYCLPSAVVRPFQQDNQPSKFWTVQRQFTTKPISRPIMNDVQDPMVEPAQITITPKDFTEEAVYDRFRRKITNSAHELFRGSQNEWDMSRACVRIEQNVPSLDAATLFPLNNALNSRPLWGFPPRFIKLKVSQLQQKFIKFTNFWRRTLDCEIWARIDEDGNVISGWDRQLLDEGTKALRGDWFNAGTSTNPVWEWRLRGSPNRNNPADFDRFRDVNGNLSRVILDGAGRPFIPSVASMTSCSQCPSGAPSSWLVDGFTGSLSVDDSDTFFNGSELEHSSGCSWIFSGSGISINLDYSAPNWVLTVSGFTAGTITYTRTGALWACLGSNQMTKSAGSADAPTTLTLSPKSSGGSQAGKIGVQKYEQGDFLLLWGFPAFIG